MVTTQPVRSRGGSYIYSSSNYSLFLENLLTTLSLIRRHWTKTLYCINEKTADHGEVTCPKLEPSSLFLLDLTARFVPELSLGGSCGRRPPGCACRGRPLRGLTGTPWKPLSGLLLMLLLTAFLQPDGVSSGVGGCETPGSRAAVQRLAQDHTRPTAPFAFVTFSFLD